MASLPCAVGTRIFTIKETGEKLTYDQMRKHLFDNPSLMEEVVPTAKAEEEAPVEESGIVQAKKRAENSENAKDHSSDLSGEAYELEGGIGLVQGFNLMGNPTYSAYKNGKRTKVDIDSYTGDMFTAKELESLKDLKKQLEDFEKSAQTQDPFKQQSRVAKTDSVPENVRKFVEDITKSLGINKKIIIITDGDFNEAQYQKHGLYGTLAQVRSAKLSADNPYEYGAKRYMPDADAFYIYYNSKLQGDKLFTVVSHELGHIVEQEVFSKSSEPTKKAVKEDYEKWFASLTGKTVEEVAKETRDITLADLIEGNTRKFDTSKDRYISSFSEYFADNVSKWARTSEKPKSAVDKYFADLVDLFKKLHSYVFDKGLYSKSIFDWLDGMYETKAAPTEEKAPKFGKIEQEILDWVAGQRKEGKNKLNMAGPLYDLILEAIELGVKAGNTIAEVVAKFKDDYKQDYKNVRKAIDFLQKGAPKSILEQLKQRNAPTKKQVQTAIDRAFAMGMGMGEAKGEQAGIREGKKSVAALLTTLLEPLKGKLNAGQISAIIRRVPKTYNPQTYDKFLDYVEGVIDDANYDVRLSALNGLKKAALRVLKGKDISQATAANLLSPIRNLGLNKISPEDIGIYEAMLKDIADSRTGKQVGRQFSEEDIIDFIEEQETKYQAKRDSKLQGKLDVEKELGLLPDNFTLQDYKDLLAGDIDEDAIDIKYKTPYEELLKRTLPYLAEDVKAAASNRQYDGAQKQVVADLLAIDRDKLSLPELILLNNVFSNIVESDDISNAGKIIAKVEANNRIAEFEKNPLKIRAMSPEKAAISNYQNILAGLTYNRDDSNALKTLLTSPLQRAFYRIQGKAVKESLDLSNFMLKNRISEEANHKLGILTIAQQESAEGGTFKERVERIKEMAEKQLAEAEAQLKNSDKNIKRRAKDNIDDAKLKLKIIDKYFKGKESAADVELSPAEKETMDRALNAFAKRKDNLAATTKAFYNKDMKDAGALYFPLLPYYKFGPSEEKVEGITENLFVPSVLDRTQAGSTKDRNPFLSTNISYNTDFIGVFTQKLFEADYQIETTKERFVTQNILNDKRTKLALNPVGGKGAYDVLSEKIQEIVSDQKTFSSLYKKDESVPAYLLNKLVPLFLNSIEQIPKQSTGLSLVAMNTSPSSFGAAIRSVSSTVGNKELSDALNKLRNVSSVVLRGHRGEIDIREKHHLRKGLFSDNPFFRKYSSLQQMGDDISTWTGEQTIQRGDNIVTNTALVAAYIDALIKNGKLKNAEDFDIVEAVKDIDEKSLSYAESFVDEVNNASDPTTKASNLKSKKGDVKEAGLSVKNLLWTLKGFSLANNRNLRLATGVLMDARASKEDRAEARKKIAGIGLATVLFGLVSVGLKVAYRDPLSDMVAQQILGVEPPEEDEKKRKEKFASRAAQFGFNVLGELGLGGYGALTEQAAKVIVNEGYRTAAALSEGEIPKMLGLPEKFQPFPYTDGVAGGLGIPTELAVKTAEKFFEKDPETGKTREMTPEQITTNVIIPLIALGAGAGDVYKWNDLISRKIGPKAQQDIKNAYKVQIKEELSEPGSKEIKEAKKEFDKAIKEGDFEKAREFYDAQETQFKTEGKKLKFAGDAFRSFVDDKVAPAYGVDDKDIVDLFRKASGQPMKVYINISEKGKRTGRLKLLTDQEMKFILEDYDAQYAKMKKELQFMDDLKKKNFYGMTMVYSKRGMPLWVKQYEKYKGIKP